jgi:hypothetical protein
MWIDDCLSLPGGIMTTVRKRSARLASALLVTAYFMTPAKVKGATIPDSAEFNKLLASAKTESGLLRSAAADLDTLAKSNPSRESHVPKMQAVTNHVDNCDKLLVSMKRVTETGSMWQQTAVRRVELLLKELHANLEQTAGYLNENRAKLRFTAYKEYVTANYELTTDLEALIRDLVAYGEAKQTIERLGAKLEIAD